MCVYVVCVCVDSVQKFRNLQIALRVTAAVLMHGFPPPHPKPSSRPQYSWARIFKRLRSPGIDSEKSIPLAYVAWRAGTTNRVVVPARQAWNRFRGSLKGLQIRAQRIEEGRA